MIQTETTPNPDSLKFISEKTISAIGTEEFQKSKINEISNLFIKELLEFKGVELILVSKNFLSGFIIFFDKKSIIPSSLF